VDDTPKKGNLRYGEWYSGTGGSSGVRHDKNQDRKAHESPLYEVTNNKYEEIIADAELKDTSSEKGSDDIESNSGESTKDDDDEEEGSIGSSSGEKD